MGSIKYRNGMDLKEAEAKREGAKNTQNCTKNIFMTQIITMVWSHTYSQTSWNVKSSGPEEVSLQTKLMDMMKFQLSCFKL